MITKIKMVLARTGLYTPRASKGPTEYIWRCPFCRNNIWLFGADPNEAICKVCHIFLKHPSR